VNRTLRSKHLPAITATPLAVEGDAAPPRDDGEEEEEGRRLW
jgi:hypothetical protein